MEVPKPGYERLAPKPDLHTFPSPSEVKSSEQETLRHTVDAMSLCCSSKWVNQYRLASLLFLASSIYVRCFWTGTLS